MSYVAVKKKRRHIGGKSLLHAGGKERRKRGKLAPERRKEEWGLGVPLNTFTGKGGGGRKEKEGGQLLLKKREKTVGKKSRLSTIISGERGKKRDSNSWKGKESNRSFFYLVKGRRSFSLRGKATNKSTH